MSKLMIVCWYVFHIGSCSSPMAADAAKTLAAQLATGPGSHDITIEPADVVLARHPRVPPPKTP